MTSSAVRSSLPKFYNHDEYTRLKGGEPVWTSYTRDFSFWTDQSVTITNGGANRYLGQT